MQQNVNTCTSSVKWCIMCWVWRKILLKSAQECSYHTYCADTTCVLDRCYFIGGGAPVDLGRRRAPARWPRLIGGGVAGKHRRRPRLVINYWKLATTNRVHTGQGKLEKVREFEWLGKIRESHWKCKSDWKVREIWGKILRFCTVVVMLIIVELESNPPYY